MKLQEFAEESNRDKLIKRFAKWAVDKLGLDGLPPIKISNDKEHVYRNRTFGSTNQDGTVWVYAGADRNPADSMRTLCHELVHVKQFREGIAHSGMTEEERLHIEDEANAVAGRLMREYGKLHREIYEARTGSLQPDVAAALPATYSIPELKNQDPYLQYRFGVAMAGAKGRKRRQEDGIPNFSKESPWGENEIVVSFDPNIEEYIDDALSQLGLHGKRLISTRKSEEAADVDKVSPVKPFRGYPR